LPFRNREEANHKKIDTLRGVARTKAPNVLPNNQTNLSSLQECLLLLLLLLDAQCLLRRGAVSVKIMETSLRTFVVYTSI